ncbi:MAG: hypothetical protein WD795_04725 [Woeseia sp.]
MKLIIGIIALIIGAVIFLRMRRRKAPGDETGTADSTGTARLKADFHAVSIRPGVFACKAARELEGQRFLSGSAPRIPLPECDASECSCRFAHHADRRAGDDRRTPYPSTIGLDPGATGRHRRSVEDRRGNGRDS